MKHCFSKEEDFARLYSACNRNYLHSGETGSGSILKSSRGACIVHFLVLLSTIRIECNFEIACQQDIKMLLF